MFYSRRGNRGRIIAILREKTLIGPAARKQKRKSGEENERIRNNCG